MCSIFKLIKVVLSMNQNEAAFYTNLKAHPFRVLKLHIYSVIGILEEPQSASSRYSLVMIYPQEKLGGSVPVPLHCASLSGRGSSVGKLPDEANVYGGIPRCA